MNVYLERCSSYEPQEIQAIIDIWLPIFEGVISPGDHVIIKPNWIAASHKFDHDEWESVITNPAVITAVLSAILRCLKGQGKVTITDGPQTDSQWQGIMARMTPVLWVKMGDDAGIEITIMDLRLDEWISKKDVTVSRKSLPGDPKGSTICELNENSEFIDHEPSALGYYGADYNKSETNEAHKGSVHKYKVSRTIMEADVFVNIPKMKTHKKAGITCALKNLVGINTYKNWLPHHNEGTPDQGGDQFPVSNTKTKSEVFLIEKFKSFLASFPGMGKAMIPVKNLGKVIFGDTRDTIRSGNWYGNNTLWRMVLDLNKVLAYSTPGGELKVEDFESRKKYIAVVDGVIGGQGTGPEAPDRIHSGVLIMGTNPVAVDACCAKAMGFDWKKIPSVKNAFDIQKYPLCDFKYADIQLISQDIDYQGSLESWQPDSRFVRFEPYFGWKGHIELQL